MNYVHQLLFGVYPFIALTTCLIGCLMRFDREQYTWKADSSQLFDRRTVAIASPMFHVGIIMIFFGHFFGLLTPHSWFLALGISDNAHQVIAISAGTLFGVLCWAGGAMLLLRRLRHPEVRAASRKRDIFVLAWLMLTLTIGLLTIPVSIYHALHGDATTMILLTQWVQSVATFQPKWEPLLNVSWIYKLHLFCGLTVFFIFPFTRLVHVFSFPFGYIVRPAQVVRSKYFSAR